MSVREDKSGFDLSTMAGHATLESWVASWGMRTLKELRDPGYDEWVGAPETGDIRRIYMAYKRDIWRILGFAAEQVGEDVCSWLFSSCGYAADTEQEMITVFVGSALEICARKALEGMED